MTRSLAEDLCGLAAALEEFQAVATETEARRARTHQLITIELPDALRAFAVRATLLEGLRDSTIVDLSEVFARERAERRANLIAIEGGLAR